MQNHVDVLDDDLLQRLHDRDINALAAFYDRHHQHAWSLALHLGCDVEQAEQAVEEAFLLLWRNAAHYCCEQWTPRGWLLGIVAYRSRDLLAKQDEPQA